MFLKTTDTSEDDVCSKLGILGITNPSPCVIMATRTGILSPNPDALPTLTNWILCSNISRA